MEGLIIWHAGLYQHTLVRIVTNLSEILSKLLGHYICAEIFIGHTKWHSSVGGMQPPTEAFSEKLGIFGYLDFARLRSHMVVLLTGWTEEQWRGVCFFGRQDPPPPPPLLWSQVLKFFFVKSCLKNMKNDTTLCACAVVITPWRIKNVKKDASLRRI